MVYRERGDLISWPWRRVPEKTRFQRRSGSGCERVGGYPVTKFHFFSSLGSFYSVQILSPFYVFQVFSVCLWFSDNYYYYAGCIVVMSAFSIIATVLQTRKVQSDFKMLCLIGKLKTVVFLFLYIE